MTLVCLLKKKKLRSFLSPSSRVFNWHLFFVVSVRRPQQAAALRDSTYPPLLLLRRRPVGEDEVLLRSQPIGEDKVLGRPTRSLLLRCRLLLLECPPKTTNSPNSTSPSSEYEAQHVDELQERSY